MPIFNCYCITMGYGLIWKGSKSYIFENVLFEINGFKKGKCISKKFYSRKWIHVLTFSSAKNKKYSILR